MIEEKMHDDLISRQQAVEAMYAMVDGCVCDDEWRENPHIDAIVDTLENLPSAHLPDMNVGDTIYRTEAIKVASGYCHPANIADELRKLPSAQKTGQWTDKSVFDSEEGGIDMWQTCKCSKCGRFDTRPYMYYFSEPNYCSYCGAKMQRGEQHERSN